MTNLTSLTMPTFTIDGEIQGRALLVRMRGTADMHAIEPLHDYLVSVHAESLRCRLECVVVDFRELEFLNSSCFKAFVTWITTVQDTGEDCRYRIELVSTPMLHWQRRSLNALRCFAPDIVSVRV